MAVRMTVLLDEEVDARFSAFCEDRGFKKSTLAARLIREHLDRECSPPQKVRSVNKNVRAGA